MSERLPCVVNGCDRTILPSTAADTGGRCMPCVQGRGPEGDTRPRRKVDRFAGVRDPVEILKLVHEQWMPEPLTEYVPPPRPVPDYYSRLGKKQLLQMRDFAAKLVKRDHPEAEAVASALACWTDVEMQPLQLAMLRRKMCEPGHVFRGAGSEVRDALFQWIARGREHDLELAVTAAAWLGDEVVVREFSAWQSASGGVLQRLSVPLQQLTHAAGWELDEQGRRRDLYATRCCSLVARRDASVDQVRTMIPSEQACGRCGDNLTKVLVVREPAGVLAIATCVACCEAGAEPFAAYDEHGEVRWVQDSHGAGIDPVEVEPPPVDSLQPGEERSPAFACHWGSGVSCSQLGGLPSWVQDAEYPTCPGCQRTMRIVGQVDHADVEANGVGMSYAFACRSCRMTSVVYQQT